MGKNPTKTAKNGKEYYRITFEMRKIARLRGFQKGDAKDVWGYLDYRQGKNEDCYPTIPTIAADLELDRRTIQRCLRRLEEAGIIEIKSGCGQGRKSRYKVLVRGAGKAADRRPSDGNERRQIVPRKAADRRPSKAAVDPNERRQNAAQILTEEEKNIGTQNKEKIYTTPSPTTPNEQCKPEEEEKSGGGGDERGGGRGEREEGGDGRLLQLLLGGVGGLPPGF